MVSLKWCAKQKGGIKLIDPNENIALSYLKMSNDALGTMNREKKYNLTFAISACYYSMYYSLYSILMKIGIKSEIHSCTLEIMKSLLTEFYSEENFRMINKSFNLRNISQYYPNSLISDKEINLIFSYAPLFFNKSRNILEKLDNSEIEKLRKKLKWLYS